MQKLIPLLLRKILRLLKVSLSYLLVFTRGAIYAFDWRLFLLAGTLILIFFAVFYQALRK